MIGGNAIHVLQDHPLLNTALLASSNTDKVLVIVQLNGGNDGLNTVIPLSGYNNYYNARTNIALPENKVLKIVPHPCCIQKMKVGITIEKNL